MPTPYQMTFAPSRKPHFLPVGSIYGEHTKNWGERWCIRHAKKFASGRNECSVLKITLKPVGGIKINGQNLMSGNAIMR